MIISQLIKDLRKEIIQEKAEVFPRFFKSGRGEYGEGDLFLGISVPSCRKVAKQYSNEMDLKNVEQLLHSKYHEERLTALLILVDKFHKTNPLGQDEIYGLYLKSISKYINNWDLVDLSSSKIIGEYLLNKDRSVLYKLARSKNLWERRVSIISTFAFIYKKETNETYKISEILLHDSHDLIQKAVGWMLREAGKRVSEAELLEFLDQHYKTMPRTMLRYSIERLSSEQKKKYMGKD